MNQYLYDSDGRICAAENLTTGQMTGYLYDAGGNRVAKGTGAMVSAHVNVWVGAAPLATYAMASQDAPLTFYFDDPLGTR